MSNNAVGVVGKQFIIITQFLNHLNTTKAHQSLYLKTIQIETFHLNSKQPAPKQIITPISPVIRRGIHTSFFVFRGTVGKLDVDLVLPRDLLNLMTLGPHHGSMIFLWYDALDRHLGILDSNKTPCDARISNLYKP